MIFGRQRPPADVAAVFLLLAGFLGLAIALLIFNDSWAGMLLPLAYVIGAFAGLRAEVRELELRDTVLLLRTFFRTYPIPREHVTNVVMTDRGVAIDVLNGERYAINPPDVDPDELAEALMRWWRI